jgi:hypothetical protein
MNFREATDELCAKIDHDDVAQALGVSTQTVRQARMTPGIGAYRTPPEDWERAIIMLARKRMSLYMRLIENLERAASKPTSPVTDFTGDRLHR